MDKHMAHDLDNFITGHYGEDQFKNGVEPTCANCNHAGEGVCNDCAGQDGGTTEISDKGWCENWAEKEI